MTREERLKSPKEKVVWNLDIDKIKRDGLTEEDVYDVIDKAYKKYGTNTFENGVTFLEDKNDLDFDNSMMTWDFLKAKKPLIFSYILSCDVFGINNEFDCKL